jgi:hypothetical protein
MTKNQLILAIVLLMRIGSANAEIICVAKGEYRSCETDSVSTLTGVGEAETFPLAASRALTACKERGLANLSICLFADHPYLYRLTKECAVTTCSDDSLPTDIITSDSTLTLKVVKRLRVKRNQPFNLYIDTGEAATVSLVKKLPRGLRFYSSRVISGKISKLGTYSVTVRATLNGVQKTARSVITVR